MFWLTFALRRVLLYTNMKLRLPLTLLAAFLISSSLPIFAVDVLEHYTWTTDTTLTDVWNGEKGFTVNKDVTLTLTNNASLSSGLVQLNEGAKLIVDNATLSTSAFSAMTWFYTSRGSSVEVTGSQALWTHRYYVSITEGAFLTMSAGAQANISYLAFGGTGVLTGTGTVLTLGGFTGGQGYNLQSAFGGNTADNPVMTVADGASIEAKNGIALGHRSDKNVSKDATLNVANGGTLTVEKSLNIGAGRSNNGDGTSGNGVLNIANGGVANVEVLVIGTGVSKYPVQDGIAKGTINIEKGGVLNLTTEANIALGAGATISNRGSITGVTGYTLVSGSGLYLGEFNLSSKGTDLGLSEGITINAVEGSKVGTNLTNTGDTMITVKHADIIKSIEGAYKAYGDLNGATYSYLTFGKFIIDMNTGDSGSIGGIGSGSTVNVSGDASDLAPGDINLAGGTADLTGVTGDIKGDVITGNSGTMVTTGSQTVIFDENQDVGYGMIGKDANGNTIAGASIIVGSDSQTDETAPVIVLKGDVHSKEITLKGGNMTLSDNTVTTETGITVGDNNTPAKATLVNNGTIIGDVTVNEGNTLKGSGTYQGGTTTITNSTFIVGNSPGQSIFASTSTLDASGNSIVFTVDGTQAAVKGAAAAGTYSNLLLQAGATVTGTGNTAVIEVWKGLFDATSADLSLTLIKNEAGANLVDFFAGSPSITGAYAELLKNATISIDAAGNVVLNGTLDAAYARDIIGSSAAAYVNSLWSSTQVVSDFGKLSRNQLQAPRNKELNLWMSAMGDFSSITGDQGYTYNGGGYGIGGDYAFNKSWIAGAGFGQTWGTNKSDSALMSNKQQGTMFSLYGQYATALCKTTNFFVDGYFGYGQVENKATEALSLAAPAKWSDNVYTAGLRTSWAMDAGNDFIVTPFVALDFVTAKQGSITAGTRSYNDGKMHNLSMPIGINFAKKFSLGGSHYLIPSLSVAYAPDLSRKDPSLHTSIFGEDVKYTGAKPGRNAAVINLGTRWIMSRNWSSAVNYTLEARPKMTNQAVNLSVNYSF